MKYLVFTLLFFVAVSAEYHSDDGYSDAYGGSKPQTQGRSLLKPAKKIKEKLGLVKGKTTLKKPSLLKPGSYGQSGKHEIHNPILSDTPVGIGSISSGLGHKYGKGSTDNVKMASSSGHRPHAVRGSSKLNSHSGGGIRSGQYGSNSGHGHRIRNPVGMYDEAVGHSNIRGSQGYSDAGYHRGNSDYLY